MNCFKVTIGNSIVCLCFPSTCPVTTIKFNIIFTVYKLLNFQLAIWTLCDVQRLCEIFSCPYILCPSTNFTLKSHSNMGQVCACVRRLGNTAWFASVSAPHAPRQRLCIQVQACRPELKGTGASCLQKKRKDYCREKSRQPSACESPCQQMLLTHIHISNLCLWEPQNLPYCCLQGDENISDFPEPSQGSTFTTTGLRQRLRGWYVLLWFQSNTILCWSRC